MPADMVDGEGNATHALYGFARFLCDLVERVRPRRIGVAFDESLRGETSFRSGIYPAYKAHRRGAAGGSQAPVRAVLASSARHLRDSRVRERGIRGGRHHRHAGRQRTRGGLLQRRRHSRQGPVAAHSRRRRLLGLQRQRPIPLSRDRGSFRRQSRDDRRFSRLDRRQRGQHSGGARRRPEDRRRAPRRVPLARRGVCQSRSHSEHEAARRGLGRCANCSLTRRPRISPGA